jgi:DNA-binding response OmpR family regulator
VTDPAASSTEIRALIIEDNAEHSMLLARLLAGSTHPRFVVTTAASLADGLAEFEQTQPAIILLDLSLPDSQGLRTFDSVAAAAGKVPIVVLSGIIDVSVAIQALQRGAQDYLVKGHVDNHLLLRSIQYALERKTSQMALQRANEELEGRVQERTRELSLANEKLQREVSERKRAESEALESNQQLMDALEELRGMQRDLVRRERFQALAHMAKGIAHEFNNVLTPIVGFADHLLREPAIGQAPEHVRQTLQKIRAAAVAGAKAVARVRDFARAEAGEIGPVAVAELIESVVTLTEPKWRDEALASGATVSVAQVVGEIPDVQGDAAQLREALTHLIFNATQAIGRRGLIRVGAEPRSGGVALFVQDDGCGMTETQRRHCLDPKANAGALGKRLSGYAVIHNIVARHHGALEIETGEGEGTKVSLVLPVAADGAIVSAPESPASPPPTPSAPRLRVLIADDEPMVREVIQLYLAEDGHMAETAEDGGAALEKFRAGAYDLVLTDRAMPELSGDQLAAEVKALRPEVPVILLTGFGDLMNAEGEKPAGVDAVVSKPFTMASLRAAVNEVTAGKTAG